MTLLYINIESFEYIIFWTKYLGSGYSFDSLEQRVNNFKAPIVETNRTVFGGNLLKEQNYDLINELNIENEDELERRLFTHVNDKYEDSYSGYNNDEYTHDDMLHNLNKHNKLLIKSYKCIVYKANLTSLNFLKNKNNDEIGLNFNGMLILNVLKKLNKNCNSEFDNQKCPISMFRNDPFDANCIRCIMPWMEFFKDYGTFMTKEITMGGVINKFYNIKKYEGSMRKEYKKKTIKQSSTFFHLSKSRSESLNEKKSGETNKEELEELYTLTIGPEPPGNVSNSKVISDWLEKVVHNPTPIDLELVPIKQIIPEKYLKIYENALKYYQELNNIKDLNSVNAVNSVINTVSLQLFYIVY
eukprot:XP_762923.1 hypothetical protein [Theileria parva strain Muguga]